jgi:hypothetical protein
VINTRVRLRYSDTFGAIAIFLINLLSIHHDFEEN